MRISSFVVAVAVLTLTGCAKQPAPSALIQDPAPVAVPAEEQPLPQDPIAAEPPTPMAFLGGAAAETVAAWDVGTSVETVAFVETPAYHLDAGDRVRVDVYDQPALSRTYLVEGSGLITIPLIGAVTAKGTTTAGLAASIRQRLAATVLRDPEVSVEIAAYRPFYVLGEVRNAGQYPFAPELTVLSAVAVAGGYGPRAYQHSVKITRVEQGAVSTFEAEPLALIAPGDTITIEERFF